MPKLIFLGCVVALFVLIINLCVFSFSRPYILKATNSSTFVSPFPATSDEVSLALILGASVYGNGRLSPVLEERVKTALGLYKTGVVKKILVSGDNSTPSYNEVIPIRDYLLENAIFDVPAEDIFVDFAGFNTYDSMYRAQKIFHAKNVLIVTQSFHLPRSIYVARSVGLNAYGVPARGGLSTQNTTREIFATVKTFFEVVTHARPYFLGRAIPIEGDGRESLR